MRTQRLVFILLLAGLVAVPLALAQVTNRYKIASAAEGKGYPASLAVMIASPPDYVLDYVGRLANDAQWKGPRYQATGLASLGGDAALGWSASVEKKPSNRQTIIDALVHDWDVVQEGSEPIERRVAGKSVGTLPGTWVLTQGSVMAGEARYEAGLVFPLCGRTAHLWISALLPSGDSAGGAMGFGEYRMADGSKPTAWNRAQVLATIQGVSVDGSMPAARLTAARRGRAIAGRAADCNGHPAAGLAVKLERRVGKRWVRAATGRTRADGSYSLPAKEAGPFRVVVGSKRSAAIR
ncbi:MAG: hypothetical protein WD067_09760 [Gaiellaceae bacterium]